MLRMSGILRYHDATYKILGEIIRQGKRSIVWSTTTLAEAVVNNLSKEIAEHLASKDKEIHSETRRLLYYAKRKGYINQHLQTTRAGEERLKKISYETIEMSGTWDKKWRMVMYDVPEELHGARDQIRRLLKQLGFVQLQASVWIHPLPCLDQFEQIRKVSNLENALILVETSDLEVPNRHIHHFQTLYPEVKF